MKPGARTHPPGAAGAVASALGAGLDRPPADRRPAVRAAWAGASIALPAALFGWIASGAVPTTTVHLMAKDRDQLRGLCAGLPTALLVALVVSLAGAYALGLAGERGRRLRGSLAAAAIWLDLVVFSAAIGTPATAVALTAFLAAAVLTLRSRRQTDEGPPLLAAHACAFGAALCLFHQWAHYAAGWSDFLDNARALASLLFP